MQICASDVQSYASDMQSYASNKTHPCPTRHRQKVRKAGPAPPAQAKSEKRRPSTSGRHREIRKYRTFSDALARKGGPAPNTAICYILATFGLQCIGHANLCIGRAKLCIGHAKLCIEQNTSLTHPGAGQKREKSAQRFQRRPKAGKAGPAPVGGRQREIRKCHTFFDALAQKGGPAPNTAICFVLATFELQRIGHVKLCIGSTKLCIRQNTSLPHPAQAKSEKSRPSASGAGQQIPNLFGRSYSKGWRSTKHCCLRRFSHIWAPVHRTCKSVHRTCKVTRQNTSLPHPAQAKSVKSRPSASGVSQKRE
jgi:hypothetical protein